MIPSIPSFSKIPNTISSTTNVLGFMGFSGDEVLNRISRALRELRGQSQSQNNLQLTNRVNQLEKRINSNFEADLDQSRAISSTDRKIQEVNGDLWTIRRDLNYLKLGNTAEHKSLWAAITGTQKLIQATIAGLPALIQSIIWSIILSAAFNALLNGAIGAFNSKLGQDAWNTALKALGLAREAKDDARAAATIAVKAEGKADKALGDVEWVTQTALSAMKRLENLINSEIKFLTDSTRDALLRLQERISKQELSLKALQTLVTKIQESLTTQLKNLTTTVEKLKTDLLKQLTSVKLDIGKIFGQVATLTAQIAGILLTIAGIQAILSRLRPGANVTNITNVNNNYVTNNNLVQNTTNVINQPILDSPLLRRIDATTSTNLGVSIGTQATANTINQKCGDQIFGKGGKAIGIGGKLVSGFNWLLVDRAMNLLTLGVTIHNAAMLSKDIVVTLTQAMQNIVDLMGVKDDQDNPVEISTLINNSISNFAKSVVGKENYDYWIKQWNYYNRIYQATANLFSSLLSMGDTIVNALNTISGQNAKVANALRLWGVVGEKAYGWFNPSPNFNNPMLTKLQSLQDTASTVEQVSQEPLNVKSAKEQLEAESATLADTLAQKPTGRPGKEIPEAEKEKEEFEAGKDASKGKDVDPTDKLEADD